MSLRVVYCLDTEGPLEESMLATFDRLYARGLPNTVTPSTAHLAEIQSGVYGADLADFVAPHRLAYHETWRDIHAMFAALDRNDYKDSAGQPLIISWFVLDLVGYRDNPRRRAQGQHAVWDQVQPYIEDTDSVGWHVHTLTPRRDPLGYGTSWTAITDHEISLCRRLLERGHFPATFRAGGCIERNDLSHWLERFIPFDYSCLPGAFRDGMDWRGSRSMPYHPSFTDYRRSGGMTRWMIPTLDADSHVRVTTPQDLREANGIFAFSNHDRRDITRDLRRITDWLNAEVPDWKWTPANQPFGPFQPPSITVRDGLIRTTGEVFGEPFVAVQDGEHVYRDNAMPEAPGCWSYHNSAMTCCAVAVTSPSGAVETAWLR